MNYKMIILDLDGTLTNSEKIITPHTKKRLVEAMEQGVTVVLASGRPTFGVMPLAKELELEKNGGYVLSFNGGVIYNCATKEVVFRKQLPAKENAKILRLAERENVDILTYEDESLITNNPENKYAKIESRINHLDLIKIEDMESHLSFSVPKFLMLGDPDYLAEVEVRVKDSLGPDFSVYRSDPYFLEVLPQGIDKAQSLEQLRRIVGIEVSEMIACGDGYNDLSMIKYAGLGVAMDNAVPPVREAANYITRSNDEDGVAHVVEKFIFGIAD